MYNRLGLSFPFYMGMLFLIWKELGMVNFPIHGLAVIVKKSFPIRGFERFFSHLRYATKGKFSEKLSEN